MKHRAPLALVAVLFLSASQAFGVTGSAVMLSPVPGSTFTSSSETFNWSAGSATAYWLLVGSSPNHFDIYNSGQSQALSTTVNNIPTDGRTVYVALLSLVNGSWTFNSYTYSAFGASATPTPTLTPTPTPTPTATATATPTATPAPTPKGSAVMLSPVPGSTFTSSSVTFSWSAGSATAYWLLVGSSLYGHDIYSSGLVNALSATVNNIPTDGRTIYVTLLSLVNGSWTFNSYTYSAFSSSATPTPTPTATATPTPTPAAVDPLTVADVQTIINQAVTRAVRISPNSVIAVTDREGYVLGVWVIHAGDATDGELATAVSKAGTASYLSSNQNAFTSRTAGYIIQQHFPVGVSNTAPGPLVGVGLSNLFFSDVNHFKKTDGIYCPPPFPPCVPLPGGVPCGESPGTFGSPIPFTSLDGSPGGVPLYKNGLLVGGIGVTGDGTPQPAVSFDPTQGPPTPLAVKPAGPIDPCTLALSGTILPPPPVIVRNENPFIYIGGYDKDEDIALAGQKGFAPSSSITANNVFIGGIRLPYTNSTTVASTTIVLQGHYDSRFPPQNSPGPPPGIVPGTFGGVAGEIRQPIINDPLPGMINGQARLTAADVTDIINYAAQRVKITRAAIRLPIGTQMEAFITVVNNPDADGVTPTVLGAFRTGEATFFSWDVAVQKARTAVFYSRHDFLGFGLNVAMSSRCVGFLAQCNYPPGIDGNSSGPFLTDQPSLSGFAGNICNFNVVLTAKAASSITPAVRDGIRFDLPNGITIFPGGFPLYRNGVLVGAIGVSGDGVDQDDIVAASGTHDFLAPFGIRSDQFFFRGTRLPYAKFPRDSGL
jgi:uncharacterized protein GlcG (DUF336 family)